jgi:hypothetical protein
VTRLAGPLDVRTGAAGLPTRPGGIDQTPRVGQVDIPQEAFLAVLRVDE